MEYSRSLKLVWLNIIITSEVCRDIETLDAYFGRYVFISPNNCGCIIYGGIISILSRHTHSFKLVAMQYSPKGYILIFLLRCIVVTNKGLLSSPKHFSVTHSYLLLVLQNDILQRITILNVQHEILF